MTKKTNNYAEDTLLQAAYEQGRVARRNAISREDAPHDEGDGLKAWQKGYDEEDALLEPQAKQAARVAHARAERLQAEADEAKAAAKEADKEAKK